MHHQETALNNAVFPFLSCRYDGYAPEASRVIDFCEERAGTAQARNAKGHENGKGHSNSNGANSNGASSNCSGPGVWLSHAEFEPVPEGHTQPMPPFACAMAMLPARCVLLVCEREVRSVGKTSATPVCSALRAHVCTALQYILPSAQGPGAPDAGPQLPPGGDLEGVLG